MCCKRANTRRWLLAVAALVTSTVLLHGSSLACDCGPFTIKGDFARAKAVFVGTPVDIRPVERNQFLVTFSAREAWKGVDQHEVLVMTSRSEASCGFAFELGADYLVYALPSGGGRAPLETSTCTRTRLLANAAQDLKEIGPSNIRFVAYPDTSRAIVISAFVVGILAGGAAVLWWSSRRRGMNGTPQPPSSTL